MCNCIELLDAELLKERNTALDVALVGFPAMQPRLKIATYKRHSGSRVQPKSIVASYCPVCGEKYV